MQAFSTATRFTVGSRVRCPRCGGNAAVAQLACGGFYAHQRDGHECGEQFAHVTGDCGRFLVLYTSELVEA